MPDVPKGRKTWQNTEVLRNVCAAQESIMIIAFWERLTKVNTYSIILPKHTVGPKSASEHKTDGPEFSSKIYFDILKWRMACGWLVNSNWNKSLSQCTWEISKNSSSNTSPLKTGVWLHSLIRLVCDVRPRPHVSGYFQIRILFFPDTPFVHTHPVNPTYESGVLNPLSIVKTF